MSPEYSYQLIDKNGTAIRKRRYRYYDNILGAFFDAWHDYKSQAPTDQFGMVFRIYEHPMLNRPDFLVLEGFNSPSEKYELFLDGVAPYLQELLRMCQVFGIKAPTWDEVIAE